MLTFHFTGVDGRMTEAETLTSGMVGKKVRLEFSPDWEGLSKTAVFMAGEVVRDVVVTSDEIVIPAEVLERPLPRLFVGVYGVAADGTVTPTIRAAGPRIRPGADPSGDPGTEPDLPVWAQIQQELDGVPALIEDALKEADEAGMFTGVDGKSAYAYAQEGGFTDTEAAFAAKLAVPFVTPQMFGAKADGETDDTAAIQAALNRGGQVYFPAGRYKVTRQLVALNSCRISMFKPYPCTWQADYPKSAADNWMGARIETHATDGIGLLIGDGVEVDGLYMRAMDSFRGVLLKFDGYLGCRTYPSQIRFSHIRLDCNSINTVPESMFDFVPYGSYFGILDDITIGSLRGRQFCEYGFRSVMTTTDTNWGNSMRIRNLCVDLLADYSIYIEGGPKGAANWVLENPTVQAYPYKPDQADYLYRTGHINLVTLKNMQDVLILGGCLWDMHAATVTGDPILVDNTADISCFGCDKWFEAVETVLTGKLQEAADSLNISSLSMRVSGVAETGANRLMLSDGKNEQFVDIPSVSISDEQLDNSISKWFDENAAPMPMVGRNKFNPMDNETVNGYFYADNSGYEAAASMTTSHFIEAKFGDVIRIGRSGSQVAAYHFHLYDADKNWLACMATSDSAAARTIEVENTAYIRVCWTSGTFAYADRGTAEICVTVNNANVAYEPYTVTYEGGIGSYIVLQSPDGSQFRLSVEDDGTVTAVPVNSGDTDNEPDTSIVWKISDRTEADVGYASPTAPRTIRFDTYLPGVTSGGYWNSGEAPTVAVSGEDFAFTTKKSGYGVGMPYKLKAGQTYRIAFEADAAFGLHLVYYNEEGVYVTSDTIVTDGSAAGIYDKQFTAKDYAYPVFTFRGDVGSTVAFTDIVLEGVTDNETQIV